MFCNARRICVTVGVFLVLATSATMAEMLLGSNDKPIDVPAGWTKEQTVNAVYKAVSDLATRAMPGCTIKRNFDGTDSLSIAWRVSEFQGYTVGMTANYPKNPRTYIGPVDDGLDLQIFFWPEGTVTQACRPQIMKKYGGVPWDTLLGPQIELKSLKTQISFNLSYGPKTSQELKKQFSDPYLWVQRAIEISKSSDDKDADAGKNGIQNKLENKYGTPVFGFAMAISFDKSECVSGNPIRITVHIKNISKETLVLGVTNSLMQFTISVFDSDGKAVPKLKYQMELENRMWGSVSGRGYNLNPGESMEFRFNLSQRFDLSVAGKYSVQCERNVGYKQENGKYEFRKLFSPKEPFVVSQSSDGQMIHSKQNEMQKK